MKKSTLLYIALNVVIMLTPILFIIGLRYKIQTGQVVDLKAQAAARYKNIAFADIHEIEVSSSHEEHRLTLLINVMDSVNNMELDTSTYKYITYSFKGGKLLLHYDFEKDSLDNLKTLKEIEEEDEVYGDYEKNESPHRNITLYVKSNITNVKSLNAIVTLSLENEEKLINDLSVYCDYSTLNLHAPYIIDPKENEDEDEEDNNIPYTFNHHLSLQLHDYSNADLSYFGYIKTFDLELKDESTINDYIPTETFNLAIDKESVYMIDVNDLDEVKIKYE